MENEIEDRLSGLEHIIHGLFHNLELMEYISFNLHKQSFNLFNNIGLHWVWRSLMANQILDFYKVIGKHEKYSFTKIINVANNSKFDIDFKSLQEQTEALNDKYDKTDFATVRSKYLAHQDIKVPEIKTDLTSLRSFTDETISLLNHFFDEFKKEKSEFSKDVISSFSEIFETIDEYEKVKAVLFTTQLKGNKSVEISKIVEFIKE